MIYFNELNHHNDDAVVLQVDDNGIVINDTLDIDDDNKILQDDNPAFVQPYPNDFFDVEMGLFYRDLRKFIDNQSKQQAYLDKINQVVADDENQGINQHLLKKTQSERVALMQGQLDDINDVIGEIAQSHLYGFVAITSQNEYLSLLTYYQNLNLVPNLIPVSTFFINLRSELLDYQWDFVKRQSYKRADYVCECCGDVGLTHPVEAHENWVFDVATQVQSLDKVMALCPTCHQCKHLGFQITKALEKGQNPLYKIKALAYHLKTVNNTTLEQAECLIVDSFRIWAYLSTFEWQLDLTKVQTWLDAFIPPLEKNQPTQRQYVPLLVS